MRLSRLVFAEILLCLLSSCGGGGGGASGPQPLSIAAHSPPAGTTGSAYVRYDFTASGGTSPFSWAESGSLPPGLTLSASGQLSGTPVTAGTYPVSVTVTDSSMPPLTATAPVSLVVSASPLTNIVPPTLPTGLVSYPYPYEHMDASGGSQPYTWSVDGTLPPGLVLGSDGTWSGTPTQAGTFSFSVVATDSARPPMSGQLAMQIVVANPPRFIVNATPVPPTGVLCAPYSFGFTATGEVSLTWLITAGNLPPDLFLDASSGVVTGTPMSLGTFTFTVSADTWINSVEFSSSQPFTMTVSLPGTVPALNVYAPEPPTGTVGIPFGPIQFKAGIPSWCLPLSLAWSETPALSMGLNLSPDGVLSGTPTTAGQFPIMLSVRDSLTQAAQTAATTVRVSLARPPASFTPTGSMRIGRSGHTATLLLTGKVLVTGGGNGAADATAEVYDPATGLFAATSGNMTEARRGHTATLLNLGDSALPTFGKVLIVGSTDTTAELYDPVTSTFAITGSMHHARTSPTATLLNTGKVLIVGGNTTSGDFTAELYDPASGTFSDTGSTTLLRTGHSATLLLDGRVLIAGGDGGVLMPGIDTAELYDPTAGTFAATAGKMTQPRSGHTATLLGKADGTQNGSVLIIGAIGAADSGAGADLYDPKTETFARIGSPPFEFESATASLRNDGTVLVAGGYALVYCGTPGHPVSYSNASLFAPESDGFTATGTLNVARDTHTATVLQDGTVLVVGGSSRYIAGPSMCGPNGGILSSAELFR